MIGPDGETPLALKILGDRWTIFVTGDNGEVEPGDTGSWSIDDTGHWTTVSESVGCPGCVSTFEWTLTDGVLSLTQLTSADGREPPDGERLHTEGDWVFAP